jgi:hypothetical protein
VAAFAPRELLRRVAALEAAWVQQHDPAAHPLLSLLAPPRPPPDALLRSLQDRHRDDEHLVEDVDEQ